jgi:hypothetical protein
MKALIILGAIVGFAIGTGFGLAAGGPWPTTVWRACAAALIAAFLTRWWSGVWLRGLKESLDHHHPHRAPAHLPAKPASKS